MNDWSLQDAQDRFGTVVGTALAGVPQRVTRDGRPTVIVLAVHEYERLRHLEKTSAPTLGKLLLDIPQDDSEFNRLTLPARPLEL